MDQLIDINTYTPTEQNDITFIKSHADTIIINLLEHNKINNKQKQYLTNFTPTCPKFYGIPKIHKPGAPLRPIVSQINGPTSRINELVDYYLTVAEKNVPGLLQDTTAFLNILQQYQNEFQITETTYLISLDVVSLYTNIPHEEGAEFVSQYYFDTLSQWENYLLPPITKEELKDMILFILNNCTFTFNNKFYKQNYGTTMGAIFSVKFANIYMHIFFKHFFNKYPQHKPPILARLVDDIFTLWNGDINSLNQFVHDLNNFHTTIKFELHCSTTHIQFLDTITYKENNILKTKLYIKPTDNKQYLHYHSSHPYHLKKSIPFSQALRYRRIITDDNILQLELQNLKQKFVDRDYPIRLVNTQIDKVLSTDRNNTLKYKSKQQKLQEFNKFLKGEHFLPLIIPYHPTLNQHLYQYITEEWQKFIQINPKLKHTFQKSTPQIIFKKDKTISNQLISSKHPVPWHRPLLHTDSDVIQTLAELLAENEMTSSSTTTSCKSHKCKCCESFLSQNSFQDYNKQNTYYINTPMSCNTMNLIYMIICTKCNIKYIGQTKRTLRERLTNHRSDIHLKKQTTISLHFNDVLHKFNHLKVLPIEKINVNNEQYRITREKFWICKLKTYYPFGLNYYPIIK